MLKNKERLLRTVLLTSELIEAAGYETQEIGDKNSVGIKATANVVTLANEFDESVATAFSLVDSERIVVAD